MLDGVKRRRLWWWALANGGFVAMVGMLLAAITLGDFLARLSYELPFVFRTAVSQEVLIISIDRDVKARLGQDPDVPLPRAYHTKLLERLKQDRPRLIFYDLLFDEPAVVADADSQFGRAIKTAGNVVLVGDVGKAISGNLIEEVIHAPIPELRTNAVGWGLANLPLQGDQSVGLLYPGTADYPAASWIAAQFLRFPAVNDESQRVRERWLNYYGPPSSLPSVTLDQALDPQGLPRGFFKNKIVLVGAPPQVDAAGMMREDVRTPFFRFGRRFSSLTEIHAQAILNLLHGDWLERIPARHQFLLMLVWGLGIGAGLVFARPWLAIGIAACSCLLLFAASLAAQFHLLLWWSWMIPACVQTPLALVTAQTIQYSTEIRKRRKIRRALAIYLSPEIADKVAQGDFDLSLGGKTVEATILFSDIASFSTISESLTPKETSMLLTSYFTKGTQTILDQRGTIIKYLGDGLMAVWGAPLPDARQAERAVMAAWHMIQQDRVQNCGRPLHTRIGINSGVALAGNLGSQFRFDYAVIGDTTNLASRIEQLNKLLNTQLLISDSTRKQLGDQITARSLGSFILPGRKQQTEIYEVLDIHPADNREHPWLVRFDEALHAFRAGDLDRAENSFTTVSEMLGRPDGPSVFYLQHINALKSVPIPASQPWSGQIIINSK